MMLLLPTLLLRLLLFVLLHLLLLQLLLKQKLLAVKLRSRLPCLLLPQHHCAVRAGCTVCPGRSLHWPKEEHERDSQIRLNQPFDIEPDNEVTCCLTRLQIKLI